MVAGTAGPAAPAWFCGLNVCARGARRGFSRSNRGKSRPKFLDRTIRALKRWKFDVVSMDEACRRAVTLASRRRFVCLTFDGGYKGFGDGGLSGVVAPWCALHRLCADRFPGRRLARHGGSHLKRSSCAKNRLSLVMDRTERHFNIGNASEKYQLYQFLENWMRSLAPPEVFVRDQRSLQAIRGRPRGAVA